MAKMDYDAAMKALREAGASMRCSEVVGILKDLGFTVRDGKRGNHKLFTHTHLPNFSGDSLDCGHGANAEVKKPYLTKIRRILERQEDGLRDYLRRREDD